MRRWTLRLVWAMTCGAAMPMLAHAQTNEQRNIDATKKAPRPIAVAVDPCPYRAATPYNAIVVHRPVPTPSLNMPNFVLCCDIPNQNLDTYVAPPCNWGNGFNRCGRGCGGGCDNGCGSTFSRFNLNRGCGTSSCNTGCGAAACNTGCGSTFGNFNFNRGCRTNASDTGCSAAACNTGCGSTFGNFNFNRGCGSNSCNTGCGTTTCNTGCGTTTSTCGCSNSCDRGYRGWLRFSCGTACNSGCDTGCGGCTAPAPATLPAVPAKPASNVKPVSNVEQVGCWTRNKPQSPANDCLSCPPHGPKPKHVLPTGSTLGCTGCSTFESEGVFIFGSCRQFFGEPTHRWMHGK